MKTAILTTLIVACAATAAPLSAADKPASNNQAPGMTMGMDKQMAQMQGNMKTMQQQMDKLRATTDPKAKQKLMQEHMQTMQDHMTMMRGMGGPIMQGGGQPGGMGGMAGMSGMGSKKDAASGDMAQRHDMMVQRMDMLQMMMEQMMQHDQMMPSMPAK